MFLFSILEIGQTCNCLFVCLFVCLIVLVWVYINQSDSYKHVSCWYIRAVVCSLSFCTFQTMEVLNRTLAASSRFQWADRHRGERVFFRVVEVHHCAISEKMEGFSTLNWGPDESYGNRHFTITCNCYNRADCTFQARCRYHPEYFYSNDTLDAIYIQGPSAYRLAGICQMDGSSLVAVQGRGPVRIGLPMNGRNAYFM
jgi:hypothetical protein